ncbi:MAG: hypothetical protein U0941_02100 [Planctomycetaceae bacterium]
MNCSLVYFRVCIAVSGLVITAGCSNGPVPMDAAGEQALRDDMKRVAVEEQMNRHRSPGMTGPAATQPQAPNFHPEGND